jgi:hypothetical protein
MTNSQKAVLYFESRDINAYEHNGAVFVTIGSIDIEVSGIDVEMRAEIVDENPSMYLKPKVN